jgi:hypothetical protein
MEEEFTMEQLKTYFVDELMKLENNPSPQKQLIDNKFNPYYTSKTDNNQNLGKLNSVGRNVNGLFTLKFQGGNIYWPRNSDQWVIEYSENGKLSPPDPPLLPNGGPEYVSAQAHFENNMPLGKDQKYGGFRRKKRKRTRRKRCSKKSSKKNKKTFRR